MKNLLKLSLFLIGMTILAGCPPANTVTKSPPTTSSPVQTGETKVYIPWTVEVAKEYNVVTEDLFQMQFYVDGGELLLTHMDTLRSKRVVGGVLQLGLSNPIGGVHAKVRTLAKVVAVDKERATSPYWICVVVEHGGLKRSVYFVQSSRDGRYYFSGDKRPVNGKVAIMYDNKQHTASASNQLLYYKVSLLGF